METARNWLYVQKRRAVHKVGKKEDEIDEMEKEGEKFMALATELRSEVWRGTRRSRGSETSRRTSWRNRSRH